MEQVALRLAGASAWTWIGGDDGARKPWEVVVRAFDRAVEVAAADARDAAPGEPVLVPAGEGRRLAGRHLFVRPARSGPPCRISYRGVPS